MRGAARARTWKRWIYRDEFERLMKIDCRPRRIGVGGSNPSPRDEAMGETVAGPHLNAVLAGILLLIASFSTPSFAQTTVVQQGGRRTAAITPAVLTDQDLDSITAAGNQVEIDLSAAAQGPVVTTSTTGAAFSAPVAILIVQENPGAPAIARFHPIGTASAELYDAVGQASASGATDAHCTAATTLTGSFAYTQQFSATSRTGSTVNCSCTAFAIALTPH